MITKVDQLISCFLGTKAATYVPSPTTNFLAGEGEEGTEVQHNNGLSQLRPTEEQYAFGKLMQMAMERLFDSLQVQHKADHRIYEAEIIELSEEVNLILVLPPAQKLVQMSESDPENSLNLQGMNFFKVCQIVPGQSGLVVLVI